jgi:hypothetical protein
MGASLIVPDSVTRGLLLNLGRGLAFDPSRFISGSEPVTHASRNIRPRILLLPISGTSFQEGKRDWRGATVMARIAATCPYLRVSRERLGKVIECKNCSYLFTHPLDFHRGIRARPRVPFSPTGPFCILAFPALLRLLRRLAPFSRRPAPPSLFLACVVFRQQ